MRPLWRRALLPLLVLLILNTVVFGVYTLPLLMREHRAVVREELLTQEVQRNRRITESLRERARIIGQNAADVEQFYAKVVVLPRLSILSLLEDIEKQAGAHDLKVGGRAYTETSVKGMPLGRFTAKLPVTGTYRQLAEFLRSLETSRHFVTVDRIALHEAQRGSTASLDVVISSYFKQPSAKETM